MPLIAADHCMVAGASVSCHSSRPPLIGPGQKGPVTAAGVVPLARANLRVQNHLHHQVRPREGRPSALNRPRRVGWSDRGFGQPGSAVSPWSSASHTAPPITLHHLSASFLLVTCIDEARACAWVSGGGRVGDNGEVEGGRPAAGTVTSQLCGFRCWFSVHVEEAGTNTAM